MHMSEINTDKIGLRRFVFPMIMISFYRLENKLNLRMCAKERIVQVKDTQSTVDLNIKAIECTILWI